MSRGDEIRRKSEQMKTRKGERETQHKTFHENGKKEREYMVKEAINLFLDKDINSLESYT